MFKVIMRTLWIVFCTMPLALAALKVPSISYDRSVSIGVGFAYAYITLQAALAVFSMFLLCGAQMGMKNSLIELRKSVAARKNADYKARLFTSFFVLSSVILLLAVEAHVAAILIAVMILVNTLIQGASEQYLDKIDRAESLRRPARRGM